MRKMIKGLTVTAASAILCASLGFTSMAAETGTDKMQKAPQMTQMQESRPNQGQMPKEGGEKPADMEGDQKLKEGEVPAINEENGEKPKEEEISKEDKISMEEKQPMLFSEDALTGLLELIEDLEDEDLKEELTELYDALIDALNEEKEAFEEGDLEDDEMEELRSAVQEARDALINALAEAEIDYNLEPIALEEGKETAPKEAVEGTEKTEEEVAPIEGEPPVNEDGSAAEPVEEGEDNETANPIKKLGEKVKNFFKNLFKSAE